MKMLLVGTSILEVTGKRIEEVFLMAHENAAEFVNVNISQSERQQGT